jgi:hypothetical protein
MSQESRFREKGSEFRKYPKCNIFVYRPILIIFIWLIEHYLVFNCVKNFSDRLISFRDIESQTSKKNRIIRIFADGLYDEFSTHSYSNYCDV